MNLFASITIYLIFVFTMLYDLQMIQQHSYNENKSYMKFLVSDLKNTGEVFLIKLFLAIYILMFGFTRLSIIVFVFSSIVLVINAFLTYNKHNVKLPLKYTKRIIRILFLDLLGFILMQLLIKNLSINLFVFYNYLYIMLHGVVLLIILGILYPVEKMIFNKYKKTALNKLNRMNDIKIIGITGSYGKTSTKMILQNILKTQFKGFYTPASFNTPNGIVMTLNNEQSIFNEYFICEMGAKRVHEIFELASLVHPKYAIITSIGKAHLESFKTMENILNTKMELVEALPKDGIAILNKDDAYMSKYKIKSSCEKVWIGIKNKADVVAKNIKVNKDGTTFDVVIKDQKPFKVSTILLGDKNVYNILSSIALAYKLGVDIKNIVKGVKSLEPIPHRLELKKLGNAYIIDDAFNSNPEGAKMAVEVLSLMEGEKIVITPGMVEMGKEENALNKEFGRQMASCTDQVYLIGPKHTKPIYEGLIEKGFNKDNIKVFKSFNEGYNDIMKVSGKKTVLIENDLPDSYMEE